MSRPRAWTVRLIAGSQIGGGLALAGLPFILSAQGTTLALWYWLVLNSAAGTSIAAGVWLWQGARRGVWLSIVVQAIQILTLRWSSGGFGVDAGLHLKLTVTSSGFGIQPGFAGAVHILYGSEMPWAVQLDLFAVFAASYLILTHFGIDGSHSPRVAAKTSDNVPPASASSPFTS